MTVESRRNFAGGFSQVHIASKRILIVTVLSLSIGACATVDDVEPFTVSGGVWPAAPEEARIQFVGQFSDPLDLGITPTFWERILSFGAGSEDNRMVRPMSVAVTTDGLIIFVADPDARCVHRYDLKKKQYDCLNSAGKDDDISPIGLTLIDDNWLVVTDSQTGRLYKAGLGDKELEEFYVSQALDQPTGIYWHSATERLFVTDTGRQTILEFDRAGSLKRRIGDRGTEPGRFNFPTYIWVDGQSRLLVTDSLNFRLQRFDDNGRFVHTFGENGDRPGDFSRPKGVAADQFGHIYSIDALMHSMQIFNRDGDLLLVVGGQGQKEGEFWLPNGIFITADNTIFVADSYNRRVQVFRYVGPES